MLYFNVNTGEIETIFTPVINGLNDKNEQLILLGKKGIITDGLIQYLIGGKSIGTVATSQGGTVIDGTLVNSPIVNNNNWELNGIDQSVLTNTGIISTDYSIVLEFEYLSIAPGTTRVISSRAGALATSIGDYIDPSGRYNLYLQGIWMVTSLTPLINTKYTYTIVREGINTKFYLNGILMNTFPYVSNAGNINFGGKYLNNFGTYGNIKIYQSKIYNRALTSGEVAVS
tara:strand:- start:2716 stop:3402 length:687 start_codon:yes stop_codon:yes gene_type:complete